MNATDKVKVKITKTKGPARARVSIGLQIDFDPGNAEETRHALDKLLALLRQFESPQGVTAVWSELERQIADASSQLNTH